MKRTQKVLIALTFFVLQSLQINAQEELSQLITDANNIIETVESDKYVYNQSISLSNDDFSIVDINIEEVNLKKSKTENYKYTFNLALLNKSKVERKVKKSEMALILNANDGDYILKEDNDGDSKYVDDVKLICADVDVLRDLEKIFKDIIAKAQTNWKTILDQAKEEPYEVSLDQRVRDVSFRSGLNVSQSVAFDNLKKDVLQIAIDSDSGKKQNSISVDFSLANLSANELRVKTKNDVIWLEMKTTDKLKKVIKSEDGETEFSNQFDVYFESPTAALIGKEIFINAIDKMSAVYTDRISEPSNCSECMSEIHKLFSVAEIEGFNMKGDCDVELDVLNKDETITYKFNWGDIMAKSSKLKYNSQNQELTIQADGKVKYFAIHEEGTLSKYDNKLKFEIANVESAESILSVLPKVAESCVQKFDAKDLDWVKSYFEDNLVNDRYEQTLESNEDKSCTYIYKHTDQEKNKIEEYEFNFYDVDSRQLELSISGKDIELVVKTKNKEKVFTKHDEKGKLSYSNKFNLKFGDVKTVRLAQATFKAEAENCK